MKAPRFLLIAGCMLLGLSASAQQVKLAKVALGMNEAEVKEALAPSGQTFLELDSSSPQLRYLVAAKADESYAFTLVDGKVAAYSIVHMLPEDKQPTVKAIRDSITRQTWAPVRAAGTETFWVSHADGTPGSDCAQCSPAPAGSWMALEAGAASKLASYPSASGLLRPALVPYPSGCGVSIHMTEQSAGGDADPVSSVSLQVLDLKVISAYVQQHSKH